MAGRTSELEWAFARRHSVELGYASDEREGSRSTFREIVIGDTVFPAGAAVGAELFVIGPLALGVSYDGSYDKADVDKERREAPSTWSARAGAGTFAPPSETAGARRACVSGEPAS